MDDNKKIKNFTDLIAWQKGHVFVLDIYSITNKFPKEELYGLSSQIRRAAVSITSNLAEGFSRRSRKEKIQFYQVSVSSLTEVQNQLIIAKDLDYMKRDVFKELANTSIEIAKLINALISSIRKSTTTSYQLLATLIPFMSILSLASILFPHPIHAQDKTSLGVDPIKFEMDLVAEETKNEEIKVYNLNNLDQEYLVYYEKFEIVGEYGKLNFLEKEKKEIEIIFSESTVKIPANSSKIITANFYGEKTLPQGEYYYVIFIEPIPTASTTVGSGSFVTGKIGILSYINFVHSGEILGELVKSGQIVEFSVKNDWNFISPVEFTARVNNTGTLHYNAYGTIKIRDRKGDIVDTIVLDKTTVLPGTIRRLESQEDSPSWEFKYLFGKYNAEIEVKSEDGTVGLNSSISFYVIPIKLIINSLVVLVCLCSITIIAIRRTKRSQGT